MVEKSSLLVRELYPSMYSVPVGVHPFSIVRLRISSYHFIVQVGLLSLESVRVRGYREVEPCQSILS